MYRHVSKLTLALVLLSAVVCGCANRRNTGPADNAPRYFTHRVTAQGETLGMVAKWYTGSTNNWQAILESNPGLNPKKIRIGTDILIPDQMVIKRTPMPKKVVTAATQAAETAATASTEVPPTDGTASASLGEVPSTGESAQPPSDSPPMDVTMEDSDTNEIIQQGQMAAQEETATKKSGSSKLSNWLTGNIDEEGSQPAATENTDSNTAAVNPGLADTNAQIDEDGAKLRQDADALAKQAQETGEVDPAQVQAIQDQAAALQQKALEAQAQALKDANKAIEQSNAAQQKSREELLKELTEDY